MNREEYKEDLKRRQQEHLDSVRNIYITQNEEANFIPCAHDGCPECVGTGIKKDGSMCIHHISCPCPKCLPFCMSA